MLRYQEEQINGYRLLSVPGWKAKGVVAGFFDSGLDITKESDVKKAELAIGSLLGCAGVPIRLLKQTHSTDIVEIASGKEFIAAGTEADAWFVSAAVRGLAFSIKTADCVPVLVFSPTSGFYGAAHCGWRGSVDGLLDKLIRRFAEADINLSELEIVMGPSAHACCYEVGEDVRQAVAYWEEKLKKKFLDRFLDLELLLRTQAEFLGVMPEKIISLPYCTICDKTFFSFRRDKEHAGRQISFVGKCP